MVIYHFQRISVQTQGFPGNASGKEPTCQFRLEVDTGSITGLEDPLEEAWQPGPVFSLCPGESHGQRSLEGCNTTDAT